MGSARLFRQDPSKFDFDHFIDLLHSQLKVLYGLELKYSHIGRTCNVQDLIGQTKRP